MSRRVTHHLRLPPTRNDEPGVVRQQSSRELVIDREIKGVGELFVFRPLTVR